MSVFQASSVRGYEIADGIMNTPGVFANNSAHAEAPVVASNNTVDDLVCHPNSVTSTTISFRFVCRMSYVVCRMY
jgi:hypothetical protein